MKNTPDSIVEGLIFKLQGMQTSDYATEGLAPRFHHTENLTDVLGPSSPTCWDHQVRPLKYTASFRMMKDSSAMRALPFFLRKKHLWSCYENVFNSRFIDS
jgi:hypothetical protein